MNPWITYAQAAAIHGRSKRTIRRWVHDPQNAIAVRYSDADGVMISSSDIARVEAEKTKYRMTPTFGRAAHEQEESV